MSDYPGDGEGPPPLFDAGPRMFDRKHFVTSTPTQHAILTHVAEHGSIAPIHAGVILHRARGHCGSGAKGGEGTGSACCPYASTDGLEAIKRLIKRGSLVRTGKGVYALPPGVLVVDEDVAAREEAIDRVERNADSEWRDRALRALGEMGAGRHDREFICDDLRDFMEGDEPREPRAYGAIMRRARYLGVCEPLNYWRVSARVSNHKRPERVWRFL